MKINYKGIHIHYQRTGNGSPVVLLHGFLENQSIWTTVVPVLERNFTCITIDLPGHGKTGCLGYIHSMEDMARTVHAVLDKENLPKSTLVGHSMGGYVALAFLELFPAYVSNMILLNSTSYKDSEEKRKNRDRAVKLLKKNPEAFTGMAISNLFAEKNRERFREEINAIKKQALATPLQGIISALEGMKMRKDRHDLLSVFTGKKMIIAGKEDPVLPFEQSFLEAKQCSTQFLALDGGHMGYMESKEEFIAALQKFLQ